jgi:predicted DNA-binding transcriptional regulator AlpA
MDTNANTERVAFTVAEFCDRNGISLALFWKLRDSGRAPKLMYLGRAIRISHSAEAEWQAARENPSTKEANLIARQRRHRSKQAKQAGAKAAASPRHISNKRRRKRTP